jgi:peptidoglycan/LPS O-acetylase OafA/YrhL
MGAAAGSAPQGRYYIALDGARGIFFLCILSLHALEVWNHLPLPSALTLPYVALQWSWMAVDMFFILSGFLITGILLQMRGVRYATRTFYFRRALRIFPPYYLVLALLAVWMVWEAGSIAAITQKSHLSFWVYLQNFYIARNGWGDFRPVTHLWSLAVEEQFYLLWPLLVLMLPIRRLWWILIGLFFLAILLRVVMVLNGASSLAIYVLLFTRLDDLAAGSLLALMASSAAGRETLLRWAPYLMAVGLAGVATIWAVRGQYWLRDPVVQMFGYTSNILFGVGGLALLAFRDPGRLVRAVFINPLVLWLGARSYAAYLLHFPIAIGIQRMLEANGVEPLNGILTTWVATAVLTMILAELSWRYWEKPWLSLRKLYQPGKKVPTARPAADDT